MLLELKRFVDDGNTTGGNLFIDGVHECFIIEDEHRDEKKWGQMRIPEGKFEVSIRNSGGIHNRYKRKFSAWHKGMLCIHNAPKWKIIVGETIFQYVMFHVGNSEKDTAGCPLPNSTFNLKTMRGTGSTDAYKAMYLKVIEHLLAGGKVTLKITDVRQVNNLNNQQ